MTNLKKGSSFDFDVLAENRGLALGDSENLTLVLQKFEPYPITIIITPTEGKARIEVYFRELEQSMSFEIPLALHREMSIPIQWALGILRKQGLEISIPLARIVTQVLDMIMPIHAKIAQLKILVDKAGKTQYSVCFEGKPELKVETLKELKILVEKAGKTQHYVCFEGKPQSKGD